MVLSPPQPQYEDLGIKGCKWGWLLSPLYHITYSQNFCFPSRKLQFAALKVFVPKGGTLPQGDTTTHALNWKMRLPPDHLGLLMLQTNWQ